LGGLSILDLPLLPLRIARHIADVVLHPPAPAPTPPAQLIVVDGMPEGVPPAARRPEPQLPVPSNWPFGEEFPRTCSASRLAGGALFWTDFLYDDHGATSLPVGDLKIQAPPRGTYVYPAGPAARNGADIFRVAIGLTETHTWWRIDWNTLLDASVPIALFAFDTDPARTAAAEWPAGAGVRSPRIDMALLVSGRVATLIDLTTQVTTPVEHSVDMQARSFLAQVPRSVLEPTGSWTVRLAAGLANAAGDGFADVPAERGALPGQPNVYNVAFRTNDQEPPHLNFWSDSAQAAALSSGDVSKFAVMVPWAQLAARETAPEPVITGPSTRWYVSSIELGQGLEHGWAAVDIFSTEPQFLGRVQCRGRRRRRSERRSHHHVPGLVVVGEQTQDRFRFQRVPAGAARGGRATPAVEHSGGGGRDGARRPAAGGGPARHPERLRAAAAGRERARRVPARRIGHPAHVAHRGDDLPSRTGGRAVGARTHTAGPQAAQDDRHDRGVETLPVAAIAPMQWIRYG
jgi:hypothetical protein